MDLSFDLGAWGVLQVRVWLPEWRASEWDESEAAAHEQWW